MMYLNYGKYLKNISLENKVGIIGRKKGFSIDNVINYR